MNSDLKEQIFKIIEQNPRIKAVTIANQLSITKKEVNSILYSRNGLRDKVVQNKNYQWSVKGSSTESSKSEYGKQEVKNTTLTKLAKYYLDCLVYDADYGVSTFQESKFNDLDYSEIPNLPNVSDSNFSEIFSSNNDANNLLKKIKKDRFRTGLYLGYPTSLRFHKGKKNWEGFFVEPLFLFPLQFSSTGGEYPNTDQEVPFINFSFLRKYQIADSGNILEESIQIFEELGLNDTDNEPDLDEIFQRMQVIRPDWNWKEDLDPHQLSKEPKLTELKEEGIFNRAVLINGEKSPYTTGLENELNKLTRIEEDNYKNTSLGNFINNTFNSKLEETEDELNEEETEDELNEEDKIENDNQSIIDDTLVEVIPLNNEQRNAVISSLNNPLTVITGPPGTGKSQVVTSILVNAAWKGKKVLFASKNNKAVDVVEDRVNGIGNRPILLRHGRTKYQSKLASYLTELLSTKADESDKEDYNEALSIHQDLTSKRETINEELKKVILLRNKVDKLEQSVESIRKDLGEELINYIKTSTTSKTTDLIRTLSNQFDSDIDFCIKPRNFIFKWIWGKTKKTYFDDLKSSTRKISLYFPTLGITFTEKIPSEGNIHKWQSLSKQIDERIKFIEKIHIYFGTLQKLLLLKKPETLSKELKELIEEISDNSEQLWRSWLKLQSNNLDQDQRKLLNDYATVLSLMSNSDETGDRIDKKIYSKYYQLFPRVANLLPCWAVTSLSAGKIPFHANFFDILVIDEASQCDIASALPLLYRAKNIVVIGDPKQLRHITKMRPKQDQQLMSRYDVFEDYIQWSYSKNSLFDLPRGYCNSDNLLNLRDHHRSHSQIISFSNKFFYQENLRVATKYENLKRLNDNEPAVRWISCIGETSKPATGGAFNFKEAKEVVNQLRDLVINKNYKGSIGVVSPFRLQANKIRELVFDDEKLLAGLNNLEFISDTVHKFQGDERDLMIFSPVVSKGISTGALGFLRNNGNLFNVAITRARSTLIVVGDLGQCMESGINYLSAFAEYVSKLRVEEEIKEKEQQTDFGAKYPPVTNPEKVSNWEKIFYTALYKNGIKTIPQYNVDQYQLDLAIIEDERRLDIEVDGERYHRDWTGELSRKDQIRNQRMFELGWDVMRFWVYEIRDNLEESIDKVKNWVQEKKKE